MKILITGIAGFVGSSIASYLKEDKPFIEVIGIDNLSRRGSEYNLTKLKSLGCKFIHGDIRNREDIEELPKVDWVIDCAAIPTVTAGTDGGTLSLINNNLAGTVYLLEKCKKDQAGFVILSTSRVYNIQQLNQLPLLEDKTRLVVDPTQVFPGGFSQAGISENFSTMAPVSLYGATKVASEVLALEYHHTFGFPVWVNRCGVIAGPGQFGKIDQGIFSFWIYQYLLNRPLSFIGFGGTGKQVRDFLHPFDIYRMVDLQISKIADEAPRIINLGGGNSSSMSLYELNDFCKGRLQADKIINVEVETRKFDIPYYVTDNALATKTWGWTPKLKPIEVLEQIVSYGNNNIELIKSLH